MTIRCDGYVGNSKLSVFPITWTTPTVGNGHDLNRAFGLSINYKVRKPAQKVAACAVQIWRTAVRTRLNAVHGRIQFLKEAIGGNWAPFRIPLMGRLDFITGRWMKLEFQSDYSESLVNRRRTSVQGIGFTAPLSNSSNRRAISSLQAA